MFKRILIISSTVALPVAQFELLSRINRRADNNFAYTRAIVTKMLSLTMLFLLTVDRPSRTLRSCCFGSKQKMCLEEEFHTKASVLHHKSSLCSKTEILKSSVVLITLELHTYSIVLVIPPMF